jgi:hypothetical protein
MSAGSAATLRPVLRCPRQNWRIPRRESNATREQAGRWLREGTSPESREILRKILFRASTLCATPLDEREIVAAVEEHLSRFPEFLEEFGVLFCRLCGQEQTGKLALRDLAILIVLRLAVRGRSSFETHPLSGDEPQELNSSKYISTTGFPAIGSHFNSNLVNEIP